MGQLRARLPAGNTGEYPSFEALVRIPGRSRLPKDAQLLICRLARK
jgi:hypothetical protein